MEKIMKREKSFRATTFSLLSYLGLSLNSIGKFPSFISLLCLAIWKLQSISVSISLTMTYLEGKGDSKGKVALGVSQFFLVGDLFNFENDYGLIYLIIAGFLFFSSFLFAVWILGIFKAWKRKVTKSVIMKVGCFLLYIANWVICFSFFTFFLKMFKFYIDLSATESNTITTSILAITGIISFFYLIIFILMKTFFKIETKGRDPLCIKYSEYIVTEQWNRMLVYLLLVLAPESKPKMWLLIIVDCLFNSYRYYQIYNILPYYKIFWLKVDVTGTTINLLLSIINVICLLVKAGSFPNKFVLECWLLLIPIALKISFKMLENLFERIISNQGRLNEYQKLHEFILLKKILKQRVEVDKASRFLNLSELLVLGKGLSQKSIDKNFVMKKEEFITFNRTLFTQRMKAHPTFKLFNLNFLRYSLTKTKAYLDIANQIKKLRSEKIKLSEKIVLLQFYLKIQDILIDRANNTENQQVNVWRYIILDSGSKSLKTLMTDQVNMHMKFWDHYILPDANLNSLREISNKIEEKKIEIYRIWREYDAYCKQIYIQPYLNFGIYLEQVNYRIAESKQFFKTQIRQFMSRLLTKGKIDITNETIYLNDTITISISANRENLGEIISCSESLTDCSGYNSKTLKGKNISHIMPPFYQKRHNECLTRFIDTGVSRILDSTRKVFLIAKNESIIPMLLHVKQNPAIEQGLSFIGILRPIKETRDYIIVKDSGKIDFMGLLIRDRLGIDEFPHDCSIQSYCPGFQRILKAFNRIASQSIKEQKPLAQALLDQISRHQTLEKEGVESTSRYVETMATNNTTRKEITYLDSKAQSKRFFMDMEKESKTKVLTMKNSFASLISELKESIHIYKQYNEQGDELKFRNGHIEQVFHVKVEPEIIDKEWVLILKIDGIQKSFENELISVSSFRDERKRLTFTTANTRSNKKLPSFMRDKSAQTFSQQQVKSLTGMASIPKITLLSPQGSERNLFIEQPERPTSRHGSILSPRPEGRLLEAPMDHSYSMSLSGYFQTENEKVDNLRVEDYVFIQQSDMRSQSSEGREPRSNIIPSQIQTEAPISNRPEDSDKGLESHESEDKVTVHKMMKMLNLRDDAQTSNASSSHVMNHFRDRVNESCLDYEYIPNYFRVQYVIFFIVVFVSQVIIIIQSVTKSNSMTTIKAQSDVVITAYTRAEDLDKTTGAVRLLNALLNGHFDENGKDMYTEFSANLKKAVDTLLFSNYLLADQIDIIEDRLLNEFYFKHVKMYELDAFGAPTDFMMLNTFEAIKKIQNLCLKQLKKPRPQIPTTQIDLDLIIYNSFGSLLLECERTVSLTTDDMSLKIDDFTHSMNILLTMGLIFISLYFGATIFILRIMNTKSSHFSTVLSRVSEEEILEIKSGLETFLQKLTYGLEYRNNTESNVYSSRLKTMKHIDKAKAKKKITLKNFNLSSTYLVNIYTATNFWPIFFIIIIFMLIIHTNSSSEITSLSRFQSQLVMATHYMYYTNLGYVGLIDLITLNGTTKIREKPVALELNRIFKFGGNNEDYVKPFRNSDGSFDLSQYTLLFNTSCHDTTIVRLEHKDLCMQLSGQTGEVGLLMMNSNYEKILGDLKYSWEVSTRTTDLISDFLHRYYEYITPVIELQEMFTKTLAKKTDELFKNYIEKEKKTVEIVLIAELVVTVLISVGMTSLLLKRNIMKENEFKSILKLIPTNMLINNRYLKSYLIMTSGKIGDMLKKITK